MPSIRKNPSNLKSTAPIRRRLSAVERESQLVAGAIRFFSRNGVDAQLRDLARELGITHTLMYHYFPTKQALLERVYEDIFEGGWRSEWDTLLDDKRIDLPEKLSRFYVSYAQAILVSDWVRVFVYSGLSGRFITERYFSMLRVKLFSRIHRETQRYLGFRTRKPPTEREMERILGLHGSVFYMGMRRWIYGLDSNLEVTENVEADQKIPTSLPTAEIDPIHIEDKVIAYVASLQFRDLALEGRGRNGSNEKKDNYSSSLISISAGTGKYALKDLRNKKRHSENHTVAHT